jgi:hypothetical protein
MLIRTGGIRFELRDTQQLGNPCPDSPALPPTSYIYLKVCRFSPLPLSQLTTYSPSP